MKTLPAFVALAAILLTAGCARNAGDTFIGWARALQSGNAETIVAFDGELARRTADIAKDARDAFMTDFAADLTRPAATASLETGFGVEPSAYHRKLFFPPGTRIVVRSQEPRGDDGMRLLVEVNYPRDRAPVYVTEVQVVWHGPAGSPPGTPQPPERPVPAFSSGYFETGHPFLSNPGYKGYELKLHSGTVRTVTLRVELAKDPKLGWTVGDLTPVVAENQYWD
ncbi:MAG TPA: hypothetical protein ENN51_04400 [candidate division WOR-3 bacterium]|uniref:Lipoprotein n=1 Tax=candidate division WOR-3 bacterium TaxID=2052148 RepID=A0A7V0T5E0_UNCW3|nr:hypothetical protein [candidate division WOR-3 bacterium]